MNRFLPQGKNLRNQKGFIPILIAIGLLLGGVVTASFVFGDFIGDAAGKIGLAVVGLLISVPAYLTSLIFPLVVDIAKWLMESSMQVQITSGWAYDYGWTFTRDLVNLFFIIILAIIALATILRIREYQFQKTLPKLIIIALLVNFSPLVVGIVVDTFNIFTNFFIEKISFTNSFGGAAELLSVQMGDMLSSVVSTESIEAFTGRLFGLVITAAYFVFGSIIFLLIALLYLCRTLAFWVLLILAPLAFLAYILPATRGWWTKWWSQLIQWGMVGLVSAFFLYLSSHLLAAATGAAGTQIFQATELVEGLEIEPEWGGGLADTLTMMLPFAVSLVFLLIGLMLGVAGGAMGGRQIVAFAQRGGKGVGRWAGKKTGSWAREKTPAWVRKRGEELATMRARPAWGSGQAGPGGWLRRRVSDVVAGAGAPITGSLRATGKLLGPAVVESRSKAISAAEAEAEKMSSTGSLLSAIRKEFGPGGSIDRAIGLASGGIKKGSVFKRILQNELSEEEKIKLGLESNKLGVVNVSERFGRSFIAQSQNMKFTELKEEDKAKGYKNIVDKLIGEATKDEIKDFSKNFWTKAEAMEAVQKFWDGPQVSKAADEFGSQFVEDYMKVVEKLPTKQFIKMNPRAALYLSGNAAQDLGFKSPEGMKSEDVRDEVKGISPGKRISDKDLVFLRNSIREAGFSKSIPSRPAVSKETRRPLTFGGKRQKEKSKTETGTGTKRPLTFGQFLRRKKKSGSN